MNEIIALLKGLLVAEISDAHKLKVASVAVDVLGVLAADLLPKVEPVAPVPPTV